MILHIYCLHDSRAERYLSPMFTASLPVLMRELSDEMRRPGGVNLLRDHPSDFCLYSLGTFDDSTGSFVSVPPSVVCLCNELLES